MVSVAQLGEAEKEKGPVNLFPAERRANGRRGRELSKTELLRHGRLVLILTMVSVAQLVEPRIVVPVVVGSIPIAHPNFLKEI